MLGPDGVYINADLEVVYPPQHQHGGGGGGGGQLLLDMGTGGGCESPSSELLLARDVEEYVPSPAPLHLDEEEIEQQQQQQQQRPPPPPYDRQQVGAKEVAKKLVKSLLNFECLFLFQAVMMARRQQQQQQQQQQQRGGKGYFI